METIDLSCGPDFNALSYTWGDPKPHNPAHSPKRRNNEVILINGHEKEVMPNLYDALLKLRSKDLTAEVPIWIDAVCINQQDHEEKALQVANMDNIYKGAKAVFIWLGSEDEHTGPAIEVLEYMSKLPSTAYTVDRWSLIDDPSTASAKITAAQWEALIVFLSRNYFNRAWIIQEVTLAREIVLLCGDRVVPQEVVRPALQYLLRSGTWQKIARYTPEWLRQVKGMHTGGGSIFQALGGWSPFSLQNTNPLVKYKPKIASMQGMSCGAADLRDLVYATYGLVKGQLSRGTLEGGTPFPEISYDPEVTVEDVFVKWAHFMLNKGPDEGEDYWLLTLVSDPTHRRLHDLPSWVPDLSASGNPGPLGQVLRGPYEDVWYPSGVRWNGRSGGWLKPVDGDLRKVRTPAAHFDTVQSLGATWLDIDTSGDITSLLDIMDHDEWAHDWPLDALARCFTADARPHDLPPAAILVHWLMTVIHRKGMDDTAKEVIWSRLRRLSPLNHSKALKSLIDTMDDNVYWQKVEQRANEYQQRSVAVREGRRLFRTTKGYLGITCESIQPGDQAWIMPASPVLFILRQVNDSAFELVGSAYIEGIMMGETARQEGGLNWKEIDLV